MTQITHNNIPEALGEVLQRLGSIEQLLSNQQPQPQKPEPTKAEKLQEGLSKYGFENLPKVKTLNENQRQNLICKLSENNLPYQIAMLNFLGFFEYMKSNHTNTNEMLFKRLSEILDKPQRMVSGNFFVLNPRTTENKTRYTAHTHIETVEKDYKMLK